MEIRQQLIESALEKWNIAKTTKSFLINNPDYSATILDKPYLLTMKHIRELHSKYVKHSNIKKFHVSNIEVIDSDIIPCILGANTKTKTHISEKHSNKQYEVYDWKAETGMFMIEFSEKGNVIGYAIYCAWLYGDRGEMCDFFLANTEIYTNIVDSILHAQIKSRTPQKGVFTATYNKEAGVNIYKDISKELRGTDVIHPKVKDIKDDVKFFFDNISVFTDYNLPGQRKILVCGEPGTGKSSLAMSIAEDYQKTHCVVFFTDIMALYVHTVNTSDSEIPTVCILEDCENELRNTHSSVLNFLNGVGQPTNLAGCYVIFTTNHPNSIEGRIKKRPGRIDKIFIINAIGGEFADEVGKLYLSRFFKPEFDYNKIKGVFEGFTGAQIKSLATAALQFSLEIVAMMNNGITSIEICNIKGSTWKKWADEIAEKNYPVNKKDFSIDEIINKELLLLLIEDLKDQYRQLDEIDRGPETLNGGGVLEHQKKISY